MDVWLRCNLSVVAVGKNRSICKVTDESLEWIITTAVAFYPFLFCFCFYIMFLLTSPWSFSSVEIIMNSKRVNAAPSYVNITKPSGFWPLIQGHVLASPEVIRCPTHWCVNLTPANVHCFPILKPSNSLWIWNIFWMYSKIEMNAQSTSHLQTYTSPITGLYKYEIHTDRVM